MNEASLQFHIDQNDLFATFAAEKGATPATQNFSCGSETY
jgi:hypothetical protein